METKEERRKSKNRESSRRYSEKNKEKVREKSREYYRENKEQRKKYCKDNKDKIKKRYKKWCKKNEDKIKIRSKKYREENKEKIIEKSRKYYRENKDRHRNEKLKRNFGITSDDYNEMLKEQKCCCWICGRHKIQFKTRLAIDHCHETDKIRGLLCGGCNTGLGIVEDKKFNKRAKEYLKEFKIKKEDITK